MVRVLPPDAEKALGQPLSVEISVEIDPGKIASTQERMARFDRNLRWFEDHALEIGNTCRNRYICIAGQELFVGDTVGDVLAQAKTAHPEDDGRFVKFITKLRGYRIYANQWPMALG